MSQIQHESCLSHWPTFTMEALKKQGRSVQFGFQIKKTELKPAPEACAQIRGAELVIMRVKQINPLVPLLQLTLYHVERGSSCRRTLYTLFVLCMYCVHPLRRCCCVLAVHAWVNTWPIFQAGCTKTNKPDNLPDTSCWVFTSAALSVFFSSSIRITDNSTAQFYLLILEI